MTKAERLEEAKEHLDEAAGEAIVRPAVAIHHLILAVDALRLAVGGEPHDG